MGNYDMLDAVWEDWDDAAQEFNPFEKFKLPVKEGFWKQRNGQIIKIKDMSITHLQNSINMLKSCEAGKENPKLVELEKELGLRDTNIIIQKNEYAITFDDLRKVLKAKGIRVPNNFDGFYLDREGRSQHISHLGTLKAKWDTEKKIKS